MKKQEAPTVRIRKMADSIREPASGTRPAAAQEAPASDPARGSQPTSSSPLPTSGPRVLASSLAEAPTLPAFRAAMVSPAKLLAARLPEGYGVVERVHQGHWADLWKATAEGGRRVALKVACSQNPETEARFQAEARGLAPLTHRSIVRLHARGETSDKRPFLELEWLEGPTLTHAIADHQAGLPPRDAIRLLLPIANALSLAHDRGIVHGDVRAEHVILVPLAGDRLLPKLLDFGGSLRVQRTLAPPSPTEPTPHSQPPSADEPDGDPAVDVRAFAAMVFHAIMGRPPFTTGPAPAPPPAAVPRSGLSERDAVLWRILAEGLAPLSVNRNRTLHDLTRALAQWADLRGVEADVTGGSILRR